MCAHEAILAPSMLRFILMPISFFLDENVADLKLFLPTLTPG